MLNYLLENWIAIVALSISLINFIINAVERYESKKALLAEKNSEVRIKQSKLLDNIKLEIEWLENNLSETENQIGQLQDLIKHNDELKSNRIALNQYLSRVEQQFREAGNIKAADLAKAWINDGSLQNNISENIKLMKHMINHKNKLKELLSEQKESKKYIDNIVDASDLVKLKSLSELAEINGLLDEIDELHKKSRKQQTQLENQAKSL